MFVRIEFSMDNAAFDDSEEVGRVLEMAAKKINAMAKCSGSSMDALVVNGNTVGNVVVEKGGILIGGTAVCAECGEPNDPDAEECIYCGGEIY